MIAEEYFGVLRPTIAPWKIAPDRSGKLTKVFAITGKVSQYLYGTIFPAVDTWQRDWQWGLICSPWSSRIVLDRDAPGFEEFMRECGILPSPVKVLTGRDGGLQYHYDGRGLLHDDWPTQGSVYDRDGRQIGDIKSCGFVPFPGSVHPNGRKYQAAPDTSQGPVAEPRWQPEWTQAYRAYQEGTGHSPARYARTEGSGRNNALYDLKKKLFREELLDEDDPELHRRIYAANQMFPVPLDEEEVRVTILRIKGWKRHGHFNPDVLEYADLDVSAGSEISVQRKEIGKAVKASGDVKKSSDLREAGPPRRLDTVRRVEAKLKAEQDTHPCSVDWLGAPPGAMELYCDLADLGIESLKAGAEFAQLDASLPRASLGGPWRQQLEWLLHGNGAPLIEYHGGLAYLLSDPVAAELPRYPGVPEGVNPKAGKSLGEKLDHLTVLVRSCPGGEALTQREVAEVINHAWFRETFGLEEYRYVSVSAMSQHHVKLRKAGTIRIIAPAVRYRQGHLWHLDKAAVYRTGLKFAEDNELLPLLRHGIATALGVRWGKRVRHQLSSPFEDAASEIDFGGPEPPWT